jgi:hypothetical protein
LIADPESNPAIAALAMMAFVLFVILISFYWFLLFGFGSPESFTARCCKTTIKGLNSDTQRGGDWREADSFKLRRLDSVDAS